MSVLRQSDSVPGGTRRSYLATQFFNDFFYGYKDGVWTVPYSSEDCPPGRILRENGRKLYPEANPNVDQFYIGVYDPVSFLNGFIDPNDAIYLPFNNNKPTYVGDSTDDVQYGYLDTPGEAVPDAGPPVYTNGNVIVNSNSGASAIVLQNDLDNNLAAAYLAYQLLPNGPPLSFEPYLGAQVKITSTNTFAASYIGANPLSESGSLASGGYVWLSANKEGFDGPLPPNVVLQSGDGTVDNVPKMTLTDLEGNRTVSLSAGDNRNVEVPNLHINYTTSTIALQQSIEIGATSTCSYAHLQNINASTCVILNSGDTERVPPYAQVNGVLSLPNTSGTATLNGAENPSVTVTTPYINLPGARVFLSRVSWASSGGGRISGLLAHNTPGVGSFDIVSNGNYDNGTVNWMIVTDTGSPLFPL